MNKLKMNKFGSVLTGREFGVDTMIKISEDIEYPVILDFLGVNSLGSSFADEVLIPIAKNQKNFVEVCNAKKPVWVCVKEVAKDGGITVRLAE